MSRLARRGKTIFLVLVTLLIGETLLGVGRQLTRGTQGIDLFDVVVTPLLICVGFAALWQGHLWLRWLACLYLVAWGGVQLLIVARVAAGMASVTPPSATLVFLQLVLQLLGGKLLLGTWHVLAGIALVSLPSLRAFFDYQAMTPAQRQLARLWDEE